MNQGKRTFSLLWIAVSLMVVAVGCSTTATVKTQSADKSAKEEKPQSTDYLGEGVVLAPFMWEDGGFSERIYYPAKVLTQASENTNNEYEVKTFIGDFDVSKGETKWTRNVIMESHPAKKEELKQDMIVLFTEKPADEGLESARWHRGVIASTDELYKDRVIIDYVWHLDKSDEADRKKNVPVENIRIIDSPEME